MKYFLTYEKDSGQITGCYPENRRNIPKPNLLVSEEDYKKFHAAQSKYEIRDAEFVERIVDEDELFEIAKQSAETNINIYADNYRKKFVPNELKEEYALKEVAARAYEDNLATEKQITLLSVEAEALGIGIEDHASAIINQANLLADIWALIIQIRAEARLAVRAAKSQDELTAILESFEQKAAGKFALLQGAKN